MALATVTGSVKDFTLTSMGNRVAEIIFEIDEQIVIAGAGTLIPCEPISITPASDGSFSVDLQPSLETNPYIPYRLSILWQSGGVPRSALPDGFRIVVPAGGGYIGSMVAEVTEQRIVTKGDKGEDGADGGSEMQAEFDALVARMPQPGADSRFEVVDLNNKILMGTTDDGGVILEDAVLYASEGFTIETEDGYILFDAEAPGTFGTATTAVDTLHVFLGLGQSNMSGRGLPIGGEAKDPRILQYGAVRRILEPATIPLDMHDTASGLSPATTFSANYLKTQPPNVGALIIPAAHGATGFTSAASTLTWTVGAASAPAYDLPALAVAQALEAIEAARAAGYTVLVKGILWHQGENNSGMSQASYEGQLDALISYLRTSLGGATIPFVVGQMSLAGIDATAGRPNIDKAHSGTPSRVAYSGFAPSLRGATNDGDTTHFSKAGVEYLGKTYLAGYWQAIGNNPSAVPQAPANVSASKSDTTVTVQWSGAPAALSKAETFDLATGSTTYAWSAPPSHTTGYRVETKTGAGPWTTATRAWGMAITETVTVPTGTTQVRVTALNGAAESAPVTVTAVGA